MARTGIFHHFGTFLFFVSAILLLVTTISAPVVGDIAILKVMLTNSTQIRNSSVTFGTFGHCILDVPPDNTDQDFCFPRVIGYNPADIMAQIEGTSFSTAATDTTKALTRVMVLHPVACALAFIAFLLALGAGFFGSVMAAIVAGLTWVVTVVVMATDFALFGVIKNHVNGDGSGSNAYYSTGMWTILAAMITLLLGAFIMVFTCFSARAHRNRTSKQANAGYSTGPAPRTRFWQRRGY